MANITELKNLAFLQGLDDRALTELAPLVFEKGLERGEVLLYEAEPAGATYIVTAGVVKVYKTSAEGKEQILYLVRPGEAVNDLPLGLETENLASAEAMGPVTVYGISRADMETATRNLPELAAIITRHLFGRLSKLAGLVEDLSFRNVTGRVAKILLQYAGDGDG